MSEYTKPLPKVQEFSRPFWDAAKEHRLTVQVCKDCEARIFFPREQCPKCWSENLGWIDATGKGEIYAFSVTYEGVEKMFEEDLPIILAWVDLPEGIRMQTNIVECEPDDVSIGMPVEVVFHDVTEDISLPYFRPASD